MASPEGPTLAETLHQVALTEGFVAAQGVDLEPALSSELFRAHLARYDEWIEAGNAGAMSYLVRGRDRRADPRLVFPAAQSVFCVLAPYPARPPGAGAPSGGPRFARYLNGKDYHEEVAARLERVLVQVASRRRPQDPPLEWKVCVDTSAVLERTWAALTGLGWIGKNTLLIHPKHGSFTFIGVALLNQALGRGIQTHPDFCGHCTRCLKGCPTQAFSSSDGQERERWLDSRKCIASWTLETRGALALSAPQKRAIGDRIAGCDLCQEVCPFNRKALQVPTLQEVPPQALDDSTWTLLLQESSEDFKARARPTALSRIKPGEWSRNLAITLRNALLELVPAERTPWARTHFEAIQRRVRDEAHEFARTEWSETLAVFEENLG